MRIVLESFALAVRQELACRTQTTKSDIAYFKSADLYLPQNLPQRTLAHSAGPPKTSTGMFCDFQNQERAQPHTVL